MYHRKGKLRIECAAFYDAIQKETVREDWLWSVFCFQSIIFKSHLQTLRLAASYFLLPLIILIFVGNLALM